MRHFWYYLYANFDSEVQANNPLNPRRFINTGADELFSFIADTSIGSCEYKYCAEKFGDAVVNTLIADGIVRRVNDSILFNTPVFLREDAIILETRMKKAAEKLANELEGIIPSICELCTSVSNGFSVETNLYHILCGMVFDGSFFDYLESRGTVATSHIRESGLDYISVIYEKCPELEAFSSGLLCSYNRFANAQCSLQSFGDANGNRHDFYRFFRLLETGNLSEQYFTAFDLLCQCGFNNKDELLHHVVNFVEQDECPTAVLAIFEHFGYAENGRISVPVYTAADNKIIDSIAALINKQLGESFVSELTALSTDLPITSRKHGVSSAEIANELYHILFGLLNEELVSRGIAASPHEYPGEGRYLKCIQM